MKRALVIIPTYNERETLPEVISSVLKHSRFDILVVDDGSPDGTALFVKELMTAEERVFLLERTEKLGLGSAYIAGFKWGIENGYAYFIEMDGDSSHSPDSLPSFMQEMHRGIDLAIGSRYVNGTINVIGWDFKRLLLSKFANFYASRLLGVGLTDMTSGFRCYSKEALWIIDPERIRSSGYAFQIETAYRAWVAGCRLSEIPIIFYERAQGLSKMSKAIIGEAAALPWRLRLARLLRADRIAEADFNYDIRTVLGLVATLTGLAGSIISGVWLGTEADIITSIHHYLKTALPGWALFVVKTGLGLIAALFGLCIFFGLVLAIFSASVAGEYGSRMRSERFR